MNSARRVQRMEVMIMTMPPMNNPTVANPSVAISTPERFDAMELRLRLNPMTAIPNGMESTTIHVPRTIAPARPE
jgi:hypothetical protein